METTTFKQNGATFHFKNTMRSQLRLLRMLDKFSHDDDPDQGARVLFCIMLAFLDTVEGWGLEPVTEANTEAEFLALLDAYSETVTRDEFYELMNAVDDLRAAAANAVEKPDEALTEEEAADPN